jgi:cell wall-associated NlpC family hydrolase
VLEAEVYLDPKAMSCAAAADRDPRGADANSSRWTSSCSASGSRCWRRRARGCSARPARDGYVGYVEAAALQPAGPHADHRIAAIRTYAFAEASIKSRASGPYSINSLVHVEATEGKLAKVTGAGWMTAAHLAPIGTAEDDWAAVAERFLGAPYLWGGRESLGLDCSGLVQQALFACGRACPRDTDMQAELGAEIAAGDFGRGDLVFWKGHVAIGWATGGSSMPTATTWPPPSSPWPRRSPGFPRPGPG